MSAQLRVLPVSRWHVTTVDGARVRWLEAGSGEPLLFLHGWGLSPRTYENAIIRLCAAGVRVIAPGLPGFGGSDGLPLRDINVTAYAERVGRFVDTLDLPVPVFLAGHSLGGGVALRLAVDRPELVRSLTLVDPVGGSPSRRGMSSRPWWHWAVGAAGEVDPRSLPRLLPGVLREFVPSTVRRPLSTLLSAYAALTVDLADEAQELVASGMPVLFVWGDRDRLIAPGAFAKIESAIAHEIVEGRHGWLLAEPENFATLLRNALVVHAMLERKQRGQSPAVAPDATLSEAFPPERRHRNRSGPSSLDG